MKMKFPNIVPLPVESTIIENKKNFFIRASEDGDILCFVDPDPVYGLIFQFNSNEDGSLQTWKRTIPIFGSNSEDATNYVMQLEIDYEEGKMRPDFGDIRFTLDDGTILTYNLVSIQSNKAVFDVKIPSIPQNSQINVNIYTGNPDAIDASNPNLTYLWYDDCQSDKTADYTLVARNMVALNSSIATLSCDSNVGGYKLTALDESPNYEYFAKINSLENIQNLKIQAKIQQTGANAEAGLLLRGTPEANYIIPRILIQGWNDTYWFDILYGNEGDESSTNHQDYEFSRTAWYKMVASIYGTEISAQTYDEAGNNVTDQIYSFIPADLQSGGACGMAHFTNVNGTYAYFKEIVVSPYINPEPLWGTFSEWTKISLDEYPQEQSPPQAWKQIIPVSGSSEGDVVDYVMQLEVDYEEEKMRSDFGDIRFTLDDGTILTHNLVTVQSNKAIFDIKIPFIPQNDQVNVNIYAGNPDATTTSNPSATYLFYDDASENTDKWSLWSTSGVSTLNIVNGEFKLTTGYRDRTGAIFGSDIPLNTGLKINADIKANGGGTKCLALSLGNYGANDVIYGNASNSPCASYSYTNGYGRHGVHIDNTVTGNTYPLPNTYYPIELIVTPTYLKSTFNGETLTQIKNSAWNSSQTFNFQIQDDDDYANTDGISFDNVIIKPFIDPEPTWGTSSRWVGVPSSEFPVPSID
jgi:hypothetical protein